MEGEGVHVKTIFFFCDEPTTGQVGPEHTSRARWLPHISLRSTSPPRHNHVSNIRLSWGSRRLVKPLPVVARRTRALTNAVDGKTIMHDVPKQFELIVY